MKNLLVVSLFMITLIHNCRAVPTETSSRGPVSTTKPFDAFDFCEMQKKRDDIISKFSPDGQIAARKLLINIQNSILGSIKPLFKLATSEMLYTVNKQTNNPSLMSFLNLMTMGFDLIPIRDNSTLIDMCSYQSILNLLANPGSGYNPLPKSASQEPTETSSSSSSTISTQNPQAALYSAILNAIIQPYRQPNSSNNK